jgi:gamma-glutamyl-gamma-aminobutyrate hydrolase PuuD
MNFVIGDSCSVLPNHFGDVSDSQAPHSELSLRRDRVSYVNSEFFDADLMGAHCTSCHFDGCNFQKSSFLNSTFDSCVFHGCSFDSPLFVNTSFINCRFYKSTLSSGSFEDAHLSNLVFEQVAMPDTHFFHATVNGVVLQDCDLKNTVFFDAESSFIMDSASARTVRVEKPLSVVLVNPKEQGVSVPRVVNKLAGVADVIPIRIAMHAQEHNTPLLDEELVFLLNGLNSRDQPLSQPIPQALLMRIRDYAERYPNAASVLDRVQALVPHVHAVVLPGGEDISPLLYGQTAQVETGFSSGYHRSLLELALIEQCTNRGIPLLGVCRGFQMINVYFGAQLHQHIGLGQAGVRQLDMPLERPHQGVLAPLMGNFRTVVFHHQAVPADTLLPNLEAVTHREIQDAVQEKNWDVVMAMEQSHGVPVMGFQFHPEFFSEEVAAQQERSSMPLCNKALQALDPPVRTPGALLRSPSLQHMSPENEAFWAVIGDVAKAFRVKKQVISEISAA